MEKASLHPKNTTLTSQLESKQATPNCLLLHLDVLIGDGDDVADELAHKVLEAGNAADQVAHAVDLAPERLELAHLEEVVQILE